MSAWLTRLLKYGLGSVACLLVGGLYALGFDFTKAGTKDILYVLCDVFSVPGVLAMLVGLVVVVSNEGAFYGIGYALSVAGRALIPGGRYKAERYSDYVERKAGKKISGYGFLFILGAIFLAIGLIMFLIAELI